VLVYNANSYDDLYVEMAADLRTLNAWFIHNRLTMNSKKTQFMIFETKNLPTPDYFQCISIGNENICKTTNYKYLGLWLDSNLNFGFHVTKIKKKIAPLFGALKRIRRHIIPEILNNIYFAHIHSHLCYLISIWGMAGSTRMKTLETLQNKAIKNLRGMPILSPSYQLYSSKILPLTYLKDYEMLLIAFKIIKNRFKHNFTITTRSNVHSYATRNSENINLPQFRLNIGRNSFRYDAFSKFNEIPMTIRNLESYLQFKKYIKNYLFEKYLHSLNLS
jgi:hypothetical protein